MRYTNMSMRGGKHEHYDANGMWHGTRTYDYHVQSNVHKVYHNLKISIGYDNSRKIKLIETNWIWNKIKSIDVINTKSQ